MKRFPLYQKLLFAFVVLAFSCTREATDYRAFLEGRENVYPGKVSDVTVMPGNGRLQLQWAPSPDPSIVKYVVYWNNRADSLVVDAGSHDPRDSISVTINNLDEYNYSFLLFSYDDKGNRSVATDVNNAASYGPVYRSGLYNRLPDADEPFIVNGDGSVTLYFSEPDTINITTEISYTNENGTPSVAYLEPEENEITLSGFTPGSSVVYQSSYIPVRNAIDTFLTNAPDTFPQLFSLVQLDKGLFSEYNMWGDMSFYESGTGTHKLWDGSVGPQGWPNVFHSGGGAVPGSFSFDMGKVYESLADVEVTGRDCCHNPLEFEVWGIEDINNAIPELSPSDGNWAAEMRNKGWTLLTSVSRDGNGNDIRRYRFDDDVPPVRYIRFRVLRTATTDGYVNLSELTFRHKN